MTSIDSIRILTFGVQSADQPPAILPSMVMEHVKTLDELKKKAISIKVSLILLHETSAEQALHTLIPLRDQWTDTELIVISRETDVVHLREWASKGADAVWAENEWKEELIEYGGGRDTLIEPAAIHVAHKETKVIAIATTFSGGGSTYMSLILANYLRKKQRARVAIWEGVPERKEKLRQLNYILNDRGSLPGEQFEKLYSEVNGICFFENSIDDQTLEVAQQEFDYVIYDLGELETSANELLFFRAHVPLLIGSTAPYRWVDTARCLQKFHHRRQDRVQIVVPFADSDCLSQQRILNPGRLSHSMPVHVNVLKLEDASSQVIPKLLSSILPKKSKNPLRMFSHR